MYARESYLCSEEYLNQKCAYIALTDTRIVSRRVLLKHVYVIIIHGPKMEWNSAIAYDELGLMAISCAMTYWLCRIRLHRGRRKDLPSTMRSDYAKRFVADRISIEDGSPYGVTKYEPLAHVRKNERWLLLGLITAQPGQSPINIGQGDTTAILLTSKAHIRTLRNRRPLSA